MSHVVGAGRGGPNPDIETRRSPAVLTACGCVIVVGRYGRYPALSGTRSGKRCGGYVDGGGRSPAEIMLGRLPSVVWRLSASNAILAFMFLV